MPSNPERAEEGDRPILRALQSREETRSFYNKISAYYDLLSEKSEEPIRREGLQLLNAVAGEKALEIGFGTGHSLVALAKAVGTSGFVYGVDLSEEMLKIAQERVRREDLPDRVKLVCGDAVPLPFPNDEMDAVFMSFTLELFDTDEMPHVLGECLRVLKPGGRAVVVAMSKENDGGLMVRAFEWTHQHFPNLLDCRPIFLRRVMESSGFHIETARTRTMWVPVEIVRGVKSHAPQG